MLFMVKNPLHAMLYRMQHLPEQEIAGQARNDARDD